MATEEQLRNYLKKVTVELTQTRRRLAEVEDRRREPIAIVGMACRYPGGGDSIDGYWELLRDGRSAVSEVPKSRWDIDDFYNPDPATPGGIYTRHGSFLEDVAGWDAEFFGLPPREALRLDPRQRLLMELAWEGLENAGASATRLGGTRVGVMVGFMDTGSPYTRLQFERGGRSIIADPYLGQGTSLSVAAGRISYLLNLTGPAVTIDTACSSSLIAVHLAVDSLRRGECELAIAAGASLSLHPDDFIQGCASSMLCPDGACKTFDERANGYVLGEGGGVVVLEPLSKAIANGRRIWAVIRGTAVNQDGRSNGLTAPSRSAQVDVISRALAAARTEPDDIDYVEAHGSATHLGDAIELSALHDVFGKRSPQRPLHVGAVKSNLGHTQAAAGVAGIIKTALVLAHGYVPTNLHMTNPAEAVPADGTIRPADGVELPDRGRPHLAGVSSFGWSGTNAHIVLEAPPAPAHLPEPAAGPGAQLPALHTLPVSAATGDALRDQLTRLAGWLAGRPELDIADVAHTLQVGRAEHDNRRVLVCADTADAIKRLTTAAEQVTDAATRVVKGRPRIAFLLPGVGDQYVGLGRELYRSEPVYARAVDECVELTRERSGIDLAPMFFPTTDSPAVRAVQGDLAAMLGRDGGSADEADPLHHAELAHPFQFTVEYALAKLLAHRGIEPDLLVGYSLGEYVAACLAGVFTLADALHVVVERARLISAVPDGRMVAVAAGESQVSAAVLTSGAEVDIAALNGPSMTVLSGLPSEIEDITAQLMAAGFACRPLRSAHAFHSSLLEPARDKLAALLQSVPRKAPSLTIVSNLTGAPLTAAQATSADYWADHLVNTVRFVDSVQYCLGRDIDAFVELGAGQTLGGLVRQNLTAGPRAAVLGTLPAMWAVGDHREDRTSMLETCGRLWELGVGVDWAATHPAGARIVTLPTYPFQRTRFWPEQDPNAEPANLAGPLPTAGPVDHCYAPIWQRDLATVAPAAGFTGDAPLVVFADTDGIGKRLADAATEAGAPTVVVTAGAGGTELLRDGNRFVIDPAVPEHYGAVFAAVAELAGSAPVQVAHLWSLLAPAHNPRYAVDDELRASIRYGFDSLLLATQAFGELAAGPGIRLLTVTRGGSEIIGADALDPHQAAVHGLGRVLRSEYTGLTWSGVDLDAEGERAVEADTAQVRHELLTAPPPSDSTATHDALVGWRRGRRWLAGWGEVTLNDTALDEAGDGASPWRPDGAYLITGGTRGLGMAMARHLVKAGVRKLALVGRTALPRGEQVDPDSRAGRSLRDVGELEAAGAEVLLLTADVGNPDQLRAALRACREHFGGLHGIVHSAGLPAGGMAQRRTVAEANKVLAPKVLAMGPFAELVGPQTPAAERPEVLVLYSSAVTEFGGVGEGDYCAANSVLNSYGSALAAVAPSTRVLTVAWGPWQHDDWQDEGLKAADALAAQVREYRQEYGITDEGGCELLDRLLAAGPGCVLVLRQPIEVARRGWSEAIDIDALIGAASAAPPGQRFPRPHLRTEYVAPRNDREERIAETWGGFLGIDRVGIHDPFFDIGGNSLVGIAMVHAIEKELGIPIAPAVLFEHPTVAAFAAAIEGADVGKQQALDTSSARGQRRRRARSGNRR